MNSIIYVRDNSEMSVYEQHNACMQYAKRHGYSVNGRVLDFSGSELYAAIDKVVFDNAVNALIVYNLDSIGDFETALFYRIYLEKFGKKLISCN